MNKIVVSIVALLVAVVVFSASLPIFGSVSMETVSGENTGGGELNYILVDSHRQFSFSLDEVNDVLTVTNGTDKQTITDTDNFLYADSNFSITVSSAGDVALFGKGSDNQIVSASLNDLPVTVARVDGGVSVTSGVSVYSFGNPVYAYIPLSTGGYVSFPNETNVTIDSSVKDAFIGSYGGTTAYNGMNTGGYDLTLIKYKDGNVISGGRWVAGSDTPDNPDLLNLNPLDIDLLDKDPKAPDVGIKSVPTPTYTDGYWGYDLDGDNNAVIVSYSGLAGDITIPATVGGYTVTSLGKGGSNQNIFDTSLTNYTVVISSGITNINNNAFKGCTGLTSITIPDSVTSLGSYSFGGCTGLTTITIPGSVTNTGNYSFNGCTGLTSITIQNGVNTIGQNSFSNCTGLTTITIPDGVTEIKGNAFNGCTGLTSITIPGSVNIINSGAFTGCSSLTNINVDDANQNYSSDNGALYNKNKTELLTAPGVNDRFVVPDSVITIGSQAFYNCSGLTSITIPDSVITIGSLAFYNCSGLTSITIPDSVTNIGGSSNFTNTSITEVLNLSNIEITGTSYGLNNAEISDNIPVYLFIGNSDYITVTQKDGAVNTLLSLLPLIAVLGLIIGAIAVMLIRRV